MLDWLAPEICPICDCALKKGDCPYCPPLRLTFAPHPSPFVVESSYLAPYCSLFGHRLKQAKYGANLPVLKKLAHQFGEVVCASPYFSDVDQVVPVPSPWTRKLRRGFCTASVLAAVVAKHLKVPMCQALRLRPGDRQAGLNQRHRTKNLKHRLFSQRAAFGHVLLIDDVLTTGTTSHQAALELLGDSSQSVHVLTLCSVTTPILVT